MVNGATPACLIAVFHLVLRRQLFARSIPPRGDNTAGACGSLSWPASRRANTCTTTCGSGTIRRPARVGVAVPPGVLVAAAPNPVRNAELMAALRKKLHRPAALPTPVEVVRLGAVLLRTDPALGLTGRHAKSKILAELGFRFRHPTLVSALSDLFAPRLQTWWGVG